MTMKIMEKDPQSLMDQTGMMKTVSKTIGSVQMLVQSKSNTGPHFTFQVMIMKIMQKMKTILILNRRTEMLMLMRMIFL